MKRRKRHRCVQNELTRWKEIRLRSLVWDIILRYRQDRPAPSENVHNDTDWVSGFADIILQNVMNRAIANSTWTYRPVSILHFHMKNFCGWKIYFEVSPTWKYIAHLTQKKCSRSRHQISDLRPMVVLQIRFEPKKCRSPHAFSGNEVNPWGEFLPACQRKS